MSEQHDAPEKKTPPPAPEKPPKAPKPARPAKQREGSSGAFLAALIGIGALGACYYLWQQQAIARKDTQALEKSISQLLTVVEQKHQQQMDSIQALAGHHHEKLEQRLQSIDAIMPQLRGLLVEKQGEWSVAEVAYLLRIADHRLQLMQDIPSAERALREASRQLTLLDRTRFAPVISQIDQDLNNLAALDREGIAAKAATLASLILQCDLLPLTIAPPANAAPATSSETPTPEATEESFSTFRRWGRQLWADIKQLVTIRRSDEEPMQHPQQRYFVQETLQLKLEAARLALLQHQPSIYQQALAEADSWLQRYYNREDSEVMAFANEIARLAAADLNMQLPSLRNTEALLQQLGTTILRQEEEPQTPLPPVLAPDVAAPVPAAPSPAPDVAVPVPAAPAPAPAAPVPAPDVPTLAPEPAVTGGASAPSSPADTPVGEMKP